MEKYDKLVKALRRKALSKQCDSCKYGYHLCPDSECNDACHVEQIYADAAAAIEDMAKHITEMHERVTVLQIARGELEAEVKRLEPKRGEWVVFNKQMLINLENAREQYKELGYPHRTELGLQCSNCRKVTYVDSGIKYEFCPHCGAKMEVQE